jgi:hypothetical protein
MVDDRSKALRQSWQSLWQSGRCHPADRDVIGWTVDPT